MGANICKIIVQFARATEYKHKIHLEKEIKKENMGGQFPNLYSP